MLQGTLDVFSLDEVLGLLSGANKSGVLNITGDRGVGSVSIADGQLVGGSASSAPEATEVSDVLFELLRYEEGSFSFDGGAEATGEPRDLTTEMDKARRRLDEWSGIEAVVPSLDHHLLLAETLSTSQVTLSESEWATVVAIGEGASVGAVARRLELGEFEGSKRVKSLIERSLASITAPAHAAASPEMPVFTTQEPAPASFAGVPAEPEELSVPTDVPAVELDAAEVATGFSFDAVAADAPSFGDEAVDIEIPAMPEPPEFDAELPGEDIPAMPEAPAFDTSAVEMVDTEIPPLPEPPVAATDFGDDLVPPPPAPPAPAAPEPAPTFGGLDPVATDDLFEAPRRSNEGNAHAFGGDGSFGAEPEELPVPPAPAAPSFDPPPFDAEAFATDTPEPDDAAGAPDSPAADEKGGSLLMRYLKSNG